MTTSEEYEQKGNAAEERCAVDKEKIKLVIFLPEPTPRGHPCRSWRDGAGWRQGGQEARSYEDKKARISSKQTIRTNGPWLRATRFIPPAASSGTKSPSFTVKARP